MTEPGNDTQPAVAPSRSILSVILHAPRPVRVLVVGVLVNRTGSFFSTFLVLFLRQEGFSLHQMPIMLLVVGVGTPAGALLGGWAADRYSRRTSLIATTLLAGISLGVIGLSSSRSLQLTGIFSAAVFAQAYLPAASALLIDNSAESDRVSVFAFFRLALNVGAALGPILAALIAPHGLRWLFLVDAVTYFAFAAVLAVALPTAATAITDNGTPASEPELATAATTSRHTPLGLLIFYTSVFGISAVYSQYSSTLSLAVSAGRSAAAYATLLSLNAIIVVIAEVPLSSLTRRLPFRTPMMLGMALVSLGIAVSGEANLFALVIFGVLVWTTGEMLFSPIVNTAVAAFSPLDRIGRYQGYLSTVQAVAFAIGPALGTLIYGYSADALWVGCLAVGALSCAGMGVAGTLTPNTHLLQPDELVFLAEAAARNGQAVEEEGSGSRGPLIGEVTSEARDGDVSDG